MKENSLYSGALSQVGDGIFQKRFDIIYNLILAAVWSIAYNSVLLVLVVVPYTCKIPARSQNISVYDWKLKHIPLENITGTQRLSRCLMYENQGGNNITKACNSYEYDTTWYSSTIPADNDWVCDKEIYVANVIAYSRMGEIAGSLFFGWFGDVYGRRLTYILSLILFMTGRIISLMTSKYIVLFTFGCIISCFPSTSAVQSTALISIEISSPQHRSKMAKLRFVANSFGLCMMPFLYWLLRDWKQFFILSTAIIIPYLLYSRKMIESPQWLWVSKRTTKCLKQLRQIANINNTELISEIEEEMLRQQYSTKSENYSPLILFSGWRLAINTILQLLIWICVSVSYTVNLLRSGEKNDGNPFLEFAWQSLAEIPGYFAAAWLADRIGRRYTGFYSSIFTGVIWIFLSFYEISSLTWISSGTVTTCLVILNKLSLTVTFYVINLFNMELYPTSIRQSGMSLGNLISGGGNALAPYVMYLGRRYDARLPGVILIVASLTSAICTFCLPETLNVRLPETLEEAQNFGNRKTRHTRDKETEEERDEKEV
ncbi:hypothetical protein K1T71_004008 [Dendrolimus kikuchii]|uniref:Uncharacterized protein n=1 Tax=Dendrolimus kikuchii TaxID=765133 RepID=A0ACC1D9H1_9NEOP|nr:hypothetical protein K1T71_004008 [Dendrolimus kikuchii]